MSTPDLTLALTAHAETVIAGPTMQSLEIAARAVEADGLTVERLIGMDAPSEQCRAYFAQPAFSAWTRHEFDFRDQGAARNALAEAAQGKWLAIADGDDLFSENWLSEAVKLLVDAEGAGARIIVHPELNWGFDADNFVLAKTPQDDPTFTPYYFAVSNYYDALCAAPRQAWLDHPYAPRAVADGFAYEDWQWSIETMAAGWKHVIARDTIIFKRRRDASQTIESSRRGAVIRAIEPMAIDRIARLGKPRHKPDA